MSVLAVVLEMPPMALVGTAFIYGIMAYGLVAYGASVLYAPEGASCKRVAFCAGVAMLLLIPAAIIFNT